MSPLVNSVENILDIPVGQTFTAPPIKVTAELVGKFVDLCGFAELPHVAGETSVFSLLLGAEGGNCLYGTATLYLIKQGLEQIFDLSAQHTQDYDVVSYGYSNVSFDSPNIIGGEMTTEFTVLEIKKTRLPLLTQKKIVPVVQVKFRCVATNSRFDKEVAICEWTLGYLKMSDVL